jgi:ribonuclease HII
MVSLNFNDGPAKVMQQKSNNKYASTGAPGFKYPLDLGQMDGELHSFINYRAVTKKEVVHTDTQQATQAADQRAIANVSLYVPENVSLNQTANYEMTSGIGAIMAKGDASVGELVGMGIETITREASNMLLNNLGEARAQFQKGVASNASRYQLFNGIEFRQFQFQYKFVAKNEKESQEIEKITKVFRKHMLPDFAEGKVGFYTIPDIFEIEYILSSANGSLTTLHKFKPCALTSCEISYGGDGSFGLFFDGKPTNVSMNLTFLELEQVVKKNIDEGY